VCHFRRVLDRYRLAGAIQYTASSRSDIGQKLLFAGLRRVSLSCG